MAGAWVWCGAPGEYIMTSYIFPAYWFFFLSPSSFSAFRQSSTPKVERETSLLSSPQGAFIIRV